MGSALKKVLIWSCFSFIGASPLASANEFAQTIGAGMHFFTGASTHSLSGATGYSMNFGAEKTKGLLRPSLSAVLQYSSGSAAITSSTAEPYTLYDADFVAGFKLVAMEANIEPFLGADGVVGTGILKLSTSTTASDPNSLGFSYGFVLNIGVNVSRSAASNAFRVQGQYWYLSSTLGGISNFNLGGFRLTFGLVF